MLVYTPSYQGHAGQWIYNGFQKAWKQLGYGVVLPSAEEMSAVAAQHFQPNACSQFLHIPIDKNRLNEDYIIMATDDLAHDYGSRFLKAASKSYKTFIFAQPNTYPLPWGAARNFQCRASDETINALNQMDNVYLWTFTDVVPDYFHKWKKVQTIPLAFDSVSYKPTIDKNYGKYDICFVGGWVNNGLNEKRKIMLDIFLEFKKSGLNCGFFINKNLSHEQENALLYNSKISLNIHDAYQRTLGFDTNERTYKSLGLNGIMISDKVGQLERIFPEVKTTLDPSELVSITKDYLSLSEKELNDIKEKSRQHVLDNHCYTHRVKELLAL